MYHGRDGMTLSNINQHSSTYKGKTKTIRQKEVKLARSKRQTASTNPTAKIKKKEKTKPTPHTKKQGIISKFWPSVRSMET